MSLQALAHAKERIAQASSLPTDDGDSVDAGARASHPSDPASSPSAAAAAAAAAQNAARAATMATLAGGGSQPRADVREASLAKTAVEVKRTNSSHPSAWRAPPATLTALQRYTDMHNAMIAARRRRSFTIPSGPVQYAAPPPPAGPCPAGITQCHTKQPYAF